jgi:hypothetical protein
VTFGKKVQANRHHERLSGGAKNERQRERRTRASDHRIDRNEGRSRLGRAEVRVLLAEHREGVLKMKRTRSMCGRLEEPEEFIGCLCGRCDKIVGDVEVEMVVVSGEGGH